MTKFYVDGYDDFVMYQIVSDLTENRPGTGYTADKNALGAAIFNFIREEGKIRTQENPEWNTINNINIAIKETEYETIVEIMNSGSTKILERFIMRKIRIPNSFFERYGQRDNLNIPYAPSPLITTTPAVSPVTTIGSPNWGNASDTTSSADITHMDTIMATADTSTSSMQASVADKVDILRNMDGQEVGSISLASGVTEEPRVNKVEPYFNVLTAFDTIVRVPQTRYSEYKTSLAEAKRMYDGIERRIVKDHTVLTGEQIESIEKDSCEEGEEVKYPISVFSLNDMSVHMINNNGVFATVL